MSTAAPLLTTTARDRIVGGGRRTPRPTARPAAANLSNPSTQKNADSPSFMAAVGRAFPMVKKAVARTLGRASEYYFGVQNLSNTKTAASNNPAIAFAVDNPVNRNAHHGSEIPLQNFLQSLGCSEHFHAVLMAGLNPIASASTDKIPTMKQTLDSIRAQINNVTDVDIKAQLSADFNNFSKAKSMLKLLLNVYKTYLLDTYEIALPETAVKTAQESLNAAKAAQKSVPAAATQAVAAAARAVADAQVVLDAAKTAATADAMPAANQIKQANLHDLLRDICYAIAPTNPASANNGEKQISPFMQYLSHEFLGLGKANPNPKDNPHAVLRKLFINKFEKLGTSYEHREAGMQFLIQNGLIAAAENNNNAINFAGHAELLAKGFLGDFKSNPKTVLQHLFARRADYIAAMSVKSSFVAKGFAAMSVFFAKSMVGMPLGTAAVTLSAMFLAGQENTVYAGVEGLHDGAHAAVDGLENAFSSSPNPSNVAPNPSDVLHIKSDIIENALKHADHDAGRWVDHNVTEPIKDFIHNVGETLEGKSGKDGLFYGGLGGGVAAAFILSVAAYVKSSMRNPEARTTADDDAASIDGAGDADAAQAKAERRSRTLNVAGKVVRVPVDFVASLVVAAPAKVLMRLRRYTLYGTVFKFIEKYTILKATENMRVKALTARFEAMAADVQEVVISGDDSSDAGSDTAAHRVLQRDGGAGALTRQQELLNYLNGMSDEGLMNFVNRMDVHAFEKFNKDFPEVAARYQAILNARRTAAPTPPVPTTSVSPPPASQAVVQPRGTVAQPKTSEIHEFPEGSDAGDAHDLSATEQVAPTPSSRAESPLPSKSPPPLPRTADGVVSSRSMYDPPRAASPTGVQSDMSDDDSDGPPLMTNRGAAPFVPNHPSSPTVVAQPTENPSSLGAVPPLDRSPSNVSVAFAAPASPSSSPSSPVAAASPTEKAWPLDAPPPLARNGSDGAASFNSFALDPTPAEVLPTPPLDRSPSSVSAAETFAAASLTAASPTGAGSPSYFASPPVVNSPPGSSGISTANGGDSATPAPTTSVGAKARSDEGSISPQSPQPPQPPESDPTAWSKPAEATTP